MLATARKIRTAETINNAADKTVCQSGTLVAARRVIIATGAVRGNRLKLTASAPSGSWIKTLINNIGTSSGKITTKVACDASRKFGTSAPTAAIRLAYTAYPNKKKTIPQNRNEAGN